MASDLDAQRLSEWRASSSSRTSRSGSGVIGAGELAGVAALVLAGLAGVVLPVLPGLLLVWAAGLWWVLGDGGGAGHWAVLVVMSVLFAVGVLAKYILPAKATADRGAPLRTLVVGVVGAVAGFFLIPVLGLPVGFVVGVYLAELARLRDGRAAWLSTRTALVAIGIGMVVELAAGLAMAFTLFLGVVAT